MLDDCILSRTHEVTIICTDHAGALSALNQSRIQENLSIIYNLRLEWQVRTAQVSRCLSEVQPFFAVHA